MALSKMLPNVSIPIQRFRYASRTARTAEGERDQHRSFCHKIGTQPSREHWTTCSRSTAGCHHLGSLWAPLFHQDWNFSVGGFQTTRHGTSEGEHREIGPGIAARTIDLCGGRSEHGFPSPSVCGACQLIRNSAKRTQRI